MTNTVNMAQAVSGATVHFRCGGSAVVKGVIRYDSDDTYGFGIELDCIHGGYSYKENGGYGSKKHLIDIIRIEPPQFNWENVKRGMAFNCERSRMVVYYVGEKLDGARVFEDVGGLLSIGVADLTRAPEHDKVGG